MVFTITHFAGEVTYDVNRWLEKNNDPLSQDIKDCIENSTNSFVRDSFARVQTWLDEMAAKAAAEEAAAGGKVSSKKKKFSTSGDFAQQLVRLIAKVREAEPHFTRCLKPNGKLCADLFERNNVVEQLRYGGVLEVLKVQRVGFPCRRTHIDCWNCYKLLDIKKNYNVRKLMSNYDEKKC
jgi:myosin heavy subunit